jgi:hypothetical protein
VTAAVAIALLALALLDGALAGFRASLGRTGLINHRRSDYQAARRGAGLAGVLLTPVIIAACAGLLAHPARLGPYTRAGKAMLEVYGPYALLVLTALACYMALNWRLKYLATALILGPFTLIRPVIAILGGALALAQGYDPAVAVLAGLSVIAVLMVEPLASRVWYARNSPGPAA